MEYIAISLLIAVAVYTWFKTFAKTPTHKVFAFEISERTPFTQYDIEDFAGVVSIMCYPGTPITEQSKSSLLVKYNVLRAVAYATENKVGLYDALRVTFEPSVKLSIQ